MEGRTCISSGVRGSPRIPPHGLGLPPVSVGLPPAASPPPPAAAWRGAKSKVNLSHFHQKSTYLTFIKSQLVSLEGGW